MTFADLPVGARFRDLPLNDGKAGQNLFIRAVLTKTAEDEATFELNGKPVTVSWAAWMKVERE